MKLVVQVPCLNEEGSLATVLESIPTHIEGIDQIDVVVIDDGSTDATGAIARAHGAHVIRHTRTMGLAQSFRDGVDHALARGADIVVNTDGDNQYPQERIGDLVAPILAGRADIVIGDRQTHQIAHFSPFKKRMQRFGSWVVNKAAGTRLPDAASGFRAYSRYALYRLNVLTRFSYTMETIIQAGEKRLAITSVPIDTNPKTRESRLFANMGEHMWRSAQAILRSSVMYRPWAVFASLAVVLGTIGLIPFVRYAILMALDTGGNHLQSLILGTTLLVAAALAVALGVISDLLKSNRILTEQSLEHLKTQRYGPAQPAGAGVDSVGNRADSVGNRADSVAERASEGPEPVDAPAEGP
ncbi:glycosyltransferase family 2 protein [Demequina sp. NBRC 110051]|uniref:glycosyltransferase family 2 protein n=1 Tax=Demequina sp. NBRC 110051 TaxID=1570340 RepID=UPI000A0283B6|nr:glycosyltransferase family 2 protein [Demequina sp. NBRC 110051]